MEYDINFAPWQKLPPGYKIQWWECTEHYHWVIDSDTYSEIYACRWHARRAAWRHYKASEYNKQLKEAMGIDDNDPNTFTRKTYTI